MSALARVLALAAGSARTDEVAWAVVSEARALFDASSVDLARIPPGGSSQLVACDPPPRQHSGSPQAAVRCPASAVKVRSLHAATSSDPVPQGVSGHVLAIDVLPDRAESYLLVVTRERDLEPFDSTAAELGNWFGEAVDSVFLQTLHNERHANDSRRQEAMLSATKALNACSDLDWLLHEICVHATRMVDGDVAAVYVPDGTQGMRMAASFNVPPEYAGYRLAPGEGLSTRAFQSRRPLRVEDYQSSMGARPGSPDWRLKAAVSAGLTWAGQRRGVVTVGYTRSTGANEQQLAALEAFAEIAGVICENTTARDRLELVARTDGLTGCFNHAALYEGLGREIERAQRGASKPPALIVFDLDHFKRINDEHGHLFGDEVLRRTGKVLREVIRPYDLAARYGGDEFAVVCVESDEAAAAAVGRRSLDMLTEATADLGGRFGSATAGVAQWSPGLSATDLIERADLALLHGKQRNARRSVHRYSQLPGYFRPARFARPKLRVEQPPLDIPPVWPDTSEPTESRLRKRTRQLALASALGSRVAAMTDAQEVLDATVDELHRAFGFFYCMILQLEDDMVRAVAVRAAHGDSPGLRAFSQPAGTGLIGRCVTTGKPAVSNDVSTDSVYRRIRTDAAVHSELAVPIWVNDHLWGVINLEETSTDAFGADDVQLAETVADLVGSALRSALLFQQLEEGYLGTAEALGAALEAKDAYTADHARALSGNAEALGRRLGFDEPELRDLRFAAVFHDIGKIAIPESILNKPGALDPDEVAIMETHTLVGEQILAPVPFLARVRTIVRHEHERWDGNGYPDGLRGDEIPLESRIILACDALDAMTSDRPYRKGMPLEDARAELLRNAGTQFDPEVARALWAITAPSAPTDEQEGQEPASPP